MPNSRLKTSLTIAVTTVPVIAAAILIMQNLMLRTEAMQTLPLLIFLLQGETRTPFGMLMAGGLLTTLPLIVAFLVFQRQFISGIASGAIKA